MNKKVTTVALAGLMAVSGAVSASEARWGGLGDSSTFVADVQDIWTLPTALLDNGNAMYIEQAEVTNGWGGVHFALGGGQLGLWNGRSVGVGHAILGAASNVGTNLDFGDLTSGAGAVNNPGGYGANLNLATNADIDLIYGMSVNDNTQVAVGITYGNKTNANETTTKIDGGTANVVEAAYGDRNGTEINDTTGVFGVNLGIGMSDVGPLSGLWAGLQFDSISRKLTQKDDSVADTGENDIEDSRGATSIQVRVAGEQGGEGSSTLFDLSLDMESSTDAVKRANSGADGNIDAGETNTNDGTNGAMHVALGVAKMMTGEKGFGLGGAILEFTSINGESESKNDAAAAPVVKGEYSGSTINLKFVAGAEAQAFFEWLTLRAGISGSIWNSISGTTTYNNGVTTYADNKGESSGSQDLDLTSSVGFSVALGDLVIDGVLNQDFLEDGPYFVSGSNQDIAATVSATWSFGGQE